MKASEMKKYTNGYRYVQRIRYEQWPLVNKLLSVLNDTHKDDEWPATYTLELSKSGYVVIATFPGSVQDRGSLLKCDACGNFREYFDGQILGCDNIYCEGSWL